MIVRRVRFAGVLLALTMLCGCATSDHWMKRGGSQFSAQLHTFQREEANKVTHASATATDSQAKSYSAVAASMVTGDDSLQRKVAKPSQDKPTEKSAKAEEGAAKPDVELASADEVDVPAPPSADEPAQPVTSDTADTDTFEFEIVARDSVVDAQVDPADETPEPVEQNAIPEPSPEIEIIEIQKPSKQITRGNSEEDGWIASLSHPDAGVRALAAWKIGRLVAPSEEAVMALRNVVGDEENALVKVRMAEAVTKIVPDDVDAVELLIGSLSDGNWEVRWLAAGSLDVAAEGPAAMLAVAKLAEALDDEHAKVRQMAALTLGSFGFLADGAQPQLRGALDDNDLYVRQAADAALGCIMESKTRVR